MKCFFFRKYDTSQLTGCCAFLYENEPMGTFSRMDKMYFRGNIRPRVRSKDGVLLSCSCQVIGKGKLVLKSLLKSKFTSIKEKNFNKTPVSAVYIFYQEQSDVCYMAFPDSNSTNQPEIDSRFYIRLAIRESKETNDQVLKVNLFINIMKLYLNMLFRKKYLKSRINLKIICYSKVHSRLRYEAERYLEPETKHLCGIAYFRQVRDSTIHRGFYQKAVVILSHLPFHNLFRHLIDLTAPEYFTKGINLLIS